MVSLLLLGHSGRRSPTRHQVSLPTMRRVSVGHHILSMVTKLRCLQWLFVFPTHTFKAFNLINAQTLSRQRRATRRRWSSALILTVP